MMMISSTIYQTVRRSMFAVKWWITWGIQSLNLVFLRWLRISLQIALPTIAWRFVYFGLSFCNLCYSELFLWYPLFVFQGLILSKALKAQKDAEDESCRIAFGNLRSEVITLRNEALEKDKILHSLVERLKSSEARLSAQAEAHEAEMQELKKKVAEATENFNVEVVKHEICEIARSRA
jgi:hypothetical protein